MKKYLLALASLALVFTAAAKGPKKYQVEAPEGGLLVTVTVDGSIMLDVARDGKTLVAPSEIGIELEGIQTGTKVTKVKRGSVDVTVPAIVYTKSHVRDRYNAMTLTFKGFNLEVRAYEEGVAYRFVPTVKGAFKVAGEKVLFNFPEDATAWIPYVDPQYKDHFQSSCESLYTVSPLSGWDGDHLSLLPLLVQSGGEKLLFTESGLTNYPGMYFKGRGMGLEGVFAPYPAKTEHGGHNMLQQVVTARENYIARFDKAEPLPWRVVIATKDDTGLLSADLPWLLGEAPEGDFSWVKPGKVAWDWWNGWNLYNVPFKAGINNDTYKYYIDFAASKGIEYVILDEGWAVNKKADLFQVVPEINLEELVNYGKERGVGIILWAGYWAFDRDMEKACKVYSEMGVKGFKVDFMNRDDQPMIKFYQRAAEMCAKYKLMVDFHGASKPAGLQRTYPNVVNYEGVFGLENMKWADENTDMVTHDVSLPFIRNAVGPMDYTQGAMRNAGRTSYHPDYYEPMSQGTRVRQLAEYTVFFAPFTMLCDSPSNYIRESECVEFIASVPTVWDQTIALGGKIGDYVAIARRSGEEWYVGALTDWEPRTIEMDFSFLPEGSYEMEIFADGPNALKAARDYSHTRMPLPANRKLSVTLAPGGGWTARIVPEGCSMKSGYNMDYTVGFDTNGHYLLVNLDIALGRSFNKNEVILNMPRWTPGYYEILDFSKHVCDFAATDDEGNCIAWKKDGMNRWIISLPEKGNVNVSYRVFANRRDVASSRVEDCLAFVSPAGVCMHMEGETDHPVSISFKLPEGWEKISSGLLPDSSGRYTATDFDVLYDSPFLIGSYYTKDFVHDGRDYHFAIETPEGLEESGFENDFKKIVSAATKLMGDVPYDNYCLIHMGAGGGGLEHLNSQACYTDGTYKFHSRQAYVNFMAFTSHEYYHLYNVKCIRPAELWPFDYNREAVTPMLWVSEGLTCYYEFRLLGLSGIVTPEEDLMVLTKYFCRYAPYEGQRHMSLRQSSYDIWLNFMNMDANEADVRVNYYFKGPIVGLLMDIGIRSRSGMKKSLDDVMRGLYYRFYKEQQRGFTEEEIWALVEEVAGAPVDDLRRLTDTTDDIDYASYLDQAGLYIDTSDWSIRKVSNPTPSQAMYLKALNLM